MVCDQSNVESLDKRGPIVVPAPLREDQACCCYQQLRLPSPKL
jgi:hypothetical protein